ncbi:MAG: META domain-containing protein [Candidatus Limisoma sp.]
MKIKNLILALSVALTVASCSSKKQVVETPEAGEKKTVVTTLDGEWDVVAVRSRVVETEAGEQLPYVGFDLRSKRAYGYGGCNRIQSTLEVNSAEHSLHFGYPTTTLMSCDKMDLEQSILSAMYDVRSYKFIGDGVVLISQDGDQVVTLRRKSTYVDRTSLDGTWNIVKVLGEMVSKKMQTRPELTFATADGRISGNAGCNRINGEVKFDDASRNVIRFDNVASTRMMCPDMTTEQNVLAALSMARFFGELPNGNLSIFGTDGRTLLELSKVE